MADKAPRTRASITNLRRPALTRARLGWLAAAALTLTIFLIGLPARWTDLNSGSILATDYAEALDRLGLSVRFLASYIMGIEVVFAVALMAFGVLLFARKSDDWMVLFVSFALLAFGLSMSDFATSLRELHPAWHIPVLVHRALAWSSVVISICLFPDGRFVPRWTKGFAVVSLLFALSWIVAPPPTRKPDLKELNDFIPFLGLIAWFGAAALAQLQRLRGTRDQAQRRQTKWVVYGFAAMTLTLAAMWLPIIVLPVLRSPGIPSLFWELLVVPVSLGSFALMPLAIGVSVARHHLWDIDRLVSRTLGYGALTVLLAGIYAISVLALEQIFRGVLGDIVPTEAAGTSNLAIVSSTLIVAAFFNPLRRRIQAAVDRRFYRTRYDADLALKQFGGTIQQAFGLADVSEAVLDVVEDTVQPVETSIWLRDRRSGHQLH